MLLETGVIRRIKAADYKFIFEVNLRLIFESIILGLFLLDGGIRRDTIYLINSRTKTFVKS